MALTDLPRARRAGLNLQAIGNEVLVYDTASETAHALNGPAAFVWQQADGTRTVEQIATEMTDAFGTPADAQVVWYALEQLKRRQLLETAGSVPLELQGMTRRQFLKRATAGAVLLAVVASIVAPIPAHAQSGTCLSEHLPCADQPFPCCAGLGCCLSGAPTCEVICSD